jgi:DNA (cytosine-5)-methyltransferase 1
VRFLSLFSGIEAASVAWAPLGWQCVAVAEVDPFACALLQRRHPDVPNLGDVTQITASQIAALGPLDLVVFGSPCQDLSTAGARLGFTGARSSLFFVGAQIVRWARDHCGARWALWENVPGAFTSNEGRDFACVVAKLAGIDHVDVPRFGWGSEGVALGDHGLVEWAVLDAQWFGVAQRRRRVFALADFGAWADRPPVLLEPEGLRGDSAPRRGAGAAVAGCLDARAGEGFQGQDAYTGKLVVAELFNAEGSEGATLTASNIGKQHNNQMPIVAFHGSQDPDVSGDVTHPLGRNYGQETCALIGEGVRRLTPLECERLQGFPDLYTAPGADGPRYRSLGNSMAVPVMRWIGRQIDIASWTLWH